MHHNKVMKYIFNIISTNLSFSRTEARGTFVLAILVLATVTSSALIINKMKEGTPDKFDAVGLQEWVQEVESSYSIKKRSELVKENKPSKQAKYSPQKEIVEQKKVKKEEERVSVIYDINAATAEELRKVNGIGKAYSERIIKYRELLGGFANMDQLNEVYGITNELSLKIKKSFSIQSPNDPILINSDSVKILAKHPYISYDIAWIIINYRKQNGDIRSYENLGEIQALSDSILQKLVPYIK